MDLVKAEGRLLQSHRIEVDVLNKNIKDLQILLDDAHRSRESMKRDRDTMKQKKRATTAMMRNLVSSRNGTLSGINRRELRRRARRYNVCAIIFVPGKTESSR